MDGRHRRALIVCGLAVAVAVAVWWPPRAPATTPAPAPVPAPEPLPGDFFASYRERPPAARDAATLGELIRQFAAAVAGHATSPAEGPGFDVAETEVRNALTAAAGMSQLSSYFEYLAARRAQQEGDAMVMRAAVKNLDAFAQRFGAEPYLAFERGVLAADIRRQLGDLSGALAAIERVAVPASLPATEAADLRSYRACVQSELLRELGRLDDARDQIRLARTEAFASENQATIDAALLSEQSLALTTGRFEESIAALRAQLAVVGPQPSRLRSLLLVHLGYAEAGLAGNDPAGIERAAVALDAARQECDGSQRMRIDLRRFDLELRRGDLVAAAAIRAQCEAELGPAATASELTRAGEEFATLCARLLLAGGAASRDDDLAAQRQRQRAVVAALGREWASQPAERGGVGFLKLNRRREALAAAIGLELAVAAREKRSDGPTNAMQCVLELHSCTALARARKAPAATVSDVQKQLPPGGAVLAFVTTPQISYVFLVEAAAVRCEAVDGDLVEDPAVQTLLDALAESPGASTSAADLAALEAAARASFAHCIPAALREPVQRATALTIVGADMCGGLPFEVLVREDGRMLGEAAAIDNCPSLPLAVMIAQQSRPVAADAARVLFVGCTAPETAPTSVECFQEPTAGIDDCLRPFPAANRWLAKAATRQRFLAESLADYALVHLLLHQTTDAAAAGGALHFSDGACSQYDLRDRSCSGVVVLSACGAGRGPSRVGEGEGFHSFVGTFLWNGAHSVVASRHDLLVLPHLRTMARFQEALASGDSPARAMQKARAALAVDSDFIARVQRAMVQVFGAGQVPIISR